MPPCSTPAPAGCLDRNHRKVAHILRFANRLMTSNRYRPIREQIPSTQWFLNEFRLHNSPRYRLDLSYDNKEYAAPCVVADNRHMQIDFSFLRPESYN